MDKNNSKEVKRAVFEELSQSVRFQTVLDTVVDYLKHGQEPVIIESWNTRFKRMKPGDELWEAFFTDFFEQAFQMERMWKGSEHKTTATLNAKAERAFEEPNVIITLTPNAGGKRAQFGRIVPEELRNSLIFYGYRDKAFFTLFFRQLGYKVEEGSVADKHGLLISFGED